MMIETGLTRNEILKELIRSPHGNLSSYVDVGKVAARENAEFVAHLISFDRIKGQIRDSKVALPVISLSVPQFSDPEFIDNSLAHLALLPPRELLRAVRFAMELKLTGRMKTLRKMVERYLRAKEDNWAHWERAAVQHRRTMKELYALLHVKPSTMADAILFKGERPRGTVFEAISQLKNMSAQEASSTIMERRIPFLIAVGALGKKAKDVDLVMALIGRMSPTELVTNTKMLERMGVKTEPALRAAYEQALAKASTSKKTTMKATRAAESIQDEGLKAKMQELQEKQLKSIGGVDGNWLVLGDCSGSMQPCIDVARVVAGTLARMVKGEVHLIFFNTSPRYFNVTGKTYDEILQLTRSIGAQGGTSVGCGLQYIQAAKEEVDGIAIVSDGEENQPPMFAQAYESYSKEFDKEPTIYFYRINRARVESLSASIQDRDPQIFDLDPGATDYYALPGIAATMRVNKFSMADEILATPLLKLNDVLKPTRKEEYANA
jgi:hypothetical protein